MGATRPETKASDEALLRDLKAALPGRSLSLHTKDHKAFVRSVVLSNAAWEYTDLTRLFNLAGSRLRRWHVLLPQTSFGNTKLVVDQFPHPLDPHTLPLHWSEDTTVTASLPLGMATWDTLDARDQCKTHQLLAGLALLQGAATPRLRINYLACVNEVVSLGVTGFERLSQPELEFIYQQCQAGLSVGADGTFYLRWKSPGLGAP